MANPIRLTSKLLVSTQISVDDLPALNAVGIRTIVCNRPDGEADDQTSSRDLANAAEQLGMTFSYLPITPKMLMQDGDAEKFGEIVDKAPGEILAYCKTGRRSVSMWAVSQRSKMDNDELERTAAQSGFDISDYLDQLDDQAGSATASTVAAAIAVAEPAKKRGFFSRLFGG